MDVADKMSRARRWQFALCLALSLAFHGLLALGILMVPRAGKTAPPKTSKQRTFTVWRAEGREKAPQQQTAKEKPFAKTSADTAEQRPIHAEYEGARNSRAASDPTARDRHSEEDSPASSGRERTDEEEIITFDQERQEGELSNEGKKQTAPAPPSPQAADSEEEPPDTPDNTQAPGEGSPDSATAGETAPQPAPAASAPLTLADSALGDLVQQHGARAEDEPFPSAAENAAKPPAQGTGGTTAARRAQRSAKPIYDPALSAQAQRPGFRTDERKTRSSGRFIFGKGAALNVAATPRGRYEAEIYRRVAYHWYRACDEHRGDIIPGVLTISLRLDRRGRLVNMDLIKRSGASVSQQSFTFAAIRRAVLPSMPPEVQQEVVGELLELIFSFHFD